MLFNLRRSGFRRLSGMKAGDTFMWSPASQTPHLYIILTDPDTEGKFVIINITHFRNTPNSYVIPAGCHSCVYKPTEINFGDSMITDLSHITFQIAVNTAIPKEAMDLNIVRGIALKAMTHPAVSVEIQERLQTQWPG